MCREGTAIHKRLRRLLGVDLLRSGLLKHLEALTLEHATLRSDVRHVPRMDVVPPLGTHVVLPLEEP